jgi:hypothetical protein
MSFAPGLQQIVESHAGLAQSARELAQEVSFTVTTTNHLSEPIQAMRGRLQETNLNDLRPTESDRDVAVNQLEKLGFRIVHRGRFGTTVSGPALLVREVLGEPLMLMRLGRQRSGNSMLAALGINLPSSRVSIPALRFLER